MPSEKAKDYFKFLSEIGMTKHYGSLEATRKLVKSCQINRGKIVLDVGCGVGATPVYLFQQTECRVIGLDLIEGMTHQSQARAAQADSADRLDFVAADARYLPFQDNSFDAVIMESLNIFFVNKLNSMLEYLRVTKPGGYVGMTEMTWLQTPPKRIEDLFRNTAFAVALDCDGWISLLAEAGLTNIEGKSYRIDVRQESKDRMERYGRGSLLKVIFKMLGAVFRDSRARLYLKEGIGGVSKDILDIVGYGVYVGQKSPL
jgi:ubiquinone/menaquinone biosynthesis C-methylase UbiE